MSIYSVSGEQINAIYDINGDGKDNAFDIDGNVVWSKTIKVMTYNVGGWYTGRGSSVPSAKKDQYYTLQTRMIENADPDILFVNEYLAQFSADGTSALTMLQSLFPYVVATASGVYLGRAICSKYPIANYTTHTFTNEENRYYDSATITIDGEDITAVVTHLNYNATNQSIRVAQLNQLIAFLEPLDTFICCGDYNMLDCKSTIGADYTAMMVPLLNAGFHCANCTDFGFLETYSDQPNGTYTGCLDNIVTSSNIDILSAVADTTKLTDGINDKVDHMPLIAVLKVAA